MKSVTLGCFYRYKCLPRLLLQLNVGTQIKLLFQSNIHFKYTLPLSRSRPTPRSRSDLHKGYEEEQPYEAALSTRTHTSPSSPVQPRPPPPLSPSLPPSFPPLPLSTQHVLTRYWLPAACFLVALGRWEAYQRFLHPQPVDGLIMLIVATAGLFVNVVMALILQ